MRPLIERYFINIAKEVSTRATCIRRQVGAVCVDEDGHIISTGYNGVPAGSPHCTQKPCKGSQEKSGEGLDMCESLHAEVNAIAHCNNPKNIHEIYVTTSPCMSCMKLIVATGCRKLCYSEEYDTAALEYFNEVGGIIDCLA